MKKFLPGIILFGIVFTAALAIQVGASTVSSSQNTKEKESNSNAKLEAIFQKIETETIQGKKIKTRELKTPIVILNFWATWCLPCMEEMPSLINLKRKFKDTELTIVSIDEDESDQVKNIIKASKKLGLKNEFELVADKNTMIADQFKFSAVPVTIIYNRGKVVQFTNGPVDFNAKELEEKIKKWIAN
jgi:thiol-disulfide isomerase/thioredoxin